jgi:hypothetical protein
MTAYYLKFKWKYINQLIKVITLEKYWRERERLNFVTFSEMFYVAKLG